MNYTTYDPVTGQVLAVYQISDSNSVEQNLKDAAWISGHYPSDQYYIESGQAVEKPAAPDLPNYYFDYATKTWQLNLDQQASTFRSVRDQQLGAVDRVNPVWFSTLSAEQQSELAAYRQALLDVPQQADFPTQVIWPAKPTWL